MGNGVASRWRRASIAAMRDVEEVRDCKGRTADSPLIELGAIGGELMGCGDRPRDAGAEGSGEPG